MKFADNIKENVVLLSKWVYGRICYKISLEVGVKD